MSPVPKPRVPHDVAESARLTPAESKIEIAVHLYAQGRLSMGKAREFAGMTLTEFRQLLASRGITAHYDEADLDDEKAALRELKIEQALDRYAQGRASFAAAALQAGVSRSELTRYAYDRGMEPPVGAETPDEELE